jgi:wobble nucleotide-excising tRNase
MNKITGDFIKFINEFDIEGIKKEIENYEDEIYNCNKELDKLNQELHKLNLMQNYEKADINELMKKAKDGEVVQFFTLEKYALKYTLKYENNRFKVNNRVIAKTKLAEKYPEIYVAK